MKNKPTVGLFGTCGNSQWRLPFRERLQKEGVSFFDPNITEATHGRNYEYSIDGPAEVENLKNNTVIVLPVTSETTGSASLAEAAFCVVGALQNPKRQFILLIDKDVDQSLKDAHAASAKDSKNARSIVRGHLAEVKLPNLVLAETLEEALEKTVEAARKVETSA